VTLRAYEKPAARDDPRGGYITHLSRDLSNFAAIALLCLSACKDSAWTPMGSAEVVLSQIKVSGPAGVSKRIDQDESFGRSVMSGVSTGDSLWLEVASRIDPPSATAEASLAIALASALPRAPDRVLELVGEKYPLEEVCGIPFLRPDSSLVASYHATALAALASVRDSSLAKKRDACRSALDTAQTYKLARINPTYLVKNKPVTTPPKRRKATAKVAKPAAKPAQPPVTPADTGSSD
jgi:hypothetical protein